MRSIRPVQSTVVGAVCLAGPNAGTVGPDFLHPKAPAEAGYTPWKRAPETASANVPGGAAQRFIEAKDIPGQWWTLFHSPQLNALIGEAPKANPTIAAAQATLRQAKETVYADQGGLFPTVSASVSADREEISGANVGLPAFSPTFNLTSASLSVSYPIDVFGGVRRQIAAAQAQAEYECFELEATCLILTSNVVNSAVTLASLHDQIAATEETIKIEREQLAVVQRQFDLGATAKADLLTQQSTLAQTLATLPPLQHQLARARNQLMTYLGRFPSQHKQLHPTGVSPDGDAGADDPGHRLGARHHGNPPRDAGTGRPAAQQTVSRSFSGIVR